MTAITSAGAGSGLDLESIISASVAAKKAQMMQPLTKKQNQTQITLSGLGQLNSIISNFKTSLDALSATGAFNKRSVNITQTTTNPVLQVTANTDASNGQYNITVDKLATTNQWGGIFDSSTTKLATQDGTLTFSAGSKSFTVDVKNGDTLQNIRQRINSDGDNFGLSANIINTSDGKAKLVIDSGISGDSNGLNITASAGLEAFSTTGSKSVMSESQKASSAEINVDGNILKSDTNTFDNTIQGLKITALRVSDQTSTTANNTTNPDGSSTNYNSNNTVVTATTSGTTTTTTYSSNKVAITTDTSSITSLVQNFISAYNTMVSQTTSLSKRDSIVSGVNQNDGGALAGDSMVTSIKDLATNTLLKPSTQSSTFSTIFELGVNMDNKGVLSLDTDKFNTALSKNFDQVVALFGGTKGVAGTISSNLAKYTQTGGLISIRQDGLNTQLRSISTQENNATDQLTKYETNLRKQYGNLDTLLANMKKSASYLTTLTTTTSSSG